VLVLRLERIGDLMMSLPALHALRTSLPHADIDLVVGSWNAPLARLIPGIARIETLDVPWLRRGVPGPGLVELLCRATAWRKRCYDLALNLEGDIRSNLLLARSGARWCVGFGMAGGGPLLDLVVPFDAASHTAINGVRLANAALDRVVAADTCQAHAGRTAASALPLLQLEIPADARERAAALLAPARRQAGSNRLVGIQTGAGRAIKAWPLDRTAVVAVRLARDEQVGIVLTGGSDDRDAAATISASLRGIAPVVDLTGRLDLVGLAAVLSHLALLITPDTGPMHIAGVLGTPVVGIFGPSSPDRWGPLGRRCRIVRIDLPCSPCNRIRRPPARCIGHTPDCLAGVHEDQVLAAARALLDADTGTGEDESM
jgi:ADP-heptose:LPS heptosyltransferase